MTARILCMVILLLDIRALSSWYSDSTSRWTPLLFSYVLRRCLRVLGTFTRWSAPMARKLKKTGFINRF